MRQASLLTGESFDALAEACMQIEVSPRQHNTHTRIFLDFLGRFSRTRSTSPGITMLCPFRS